MHLNQPSTDMVADLFTADQRTLGQFLVEVPDDLDKAIVVDQIMALARVGGLLHNVREDMVFIKMRPADPDDDVHLYEESVTETVH